MYSAATNQSKDSSPSAYPQLSSNALDDLSYDYTIVLHQTLSHPSLHPSNLSILPRKKSWLLSLDVTILSDEGNAYDVVFMAARAALWDTKVPRTRGVQYARLQASKASEDETYLSTSILFRLLATISNKNGFSGGLL